MLARHAFRGITALVLATAAMTASAEDIAELLLVPAATDGDDTVETEVPDASTEPTTDAPSVDTAAVTPADSDPESTTTDPAADDDVKPEADTVAADTDATSPSDAQPAVAASKETATITPDTASAAPRPTATADAKAATPAVAAPAPPKPVKKPVLVPGTGSVVKGGGDDFEDTAWQWYYNHPKSSEEMDKRLRAPTGRSRDGTWFEGPKRGTPDVVKRVELPAPGLEGSTHGLLFATLHSGVPGRVTGQMQQDDLVFNLMRVTGQGMSVGDSPSVVVRVYLPPFEQWENRSGPTFGFRSGCYTHAIITGDDHPREGKWGLEEYWPGMFICFESSHEKRFKQDGAYLRIRGGRNGGEIMGPRITQLGWWTLGLSFSPDGMVHYFASPGVDSLTMDDHISSQFPYGYRTELVKTYFFNVCSRDDGKTWSTPWVIDDPKMYFVKRPQMATTPTKKR